MENSQSKIIYMGFGVLIFLALLTAMLNNIGSAEKIQNLKSKKDLERHSLIIATETPGDGELIEDAPVDVYVGENGTPVFKSITGDGDVVTKAALYSDLINMPSTDIYEVNIDGTVYSNGNSSSPTINGHMNIAYLVKNGRENELYNAIKDKKDTFIRTYKVDDDGNILSVTYKEKIS